MSVTVAISTWAGHKDVLPKAIESAKDAEQVIVIDNGWECRDVADAYGCEYIGRDPDISVVPSRNLGIKNARCEYIVHLDADDWLAEIPQPYGDWYYCDLYVETDGIISTWDYSIFPRSSDKAREYAWMSLAVPTPMKAAFSVPWLKENDLWWRSWPSVEFSEDCLTCLTYHAARPVVVYEDSPFYVYRAGGTGSSNEEWRRLFEKDLLEYLRGTA